MENNEVWSISDADIDIELLRSLLNKKDKYDLIHKTPPCATFADPGEVGNRTTFELKARIEFYTGL